VRGFFVCNIVFIQNLLANKLFWTCPADFNLHKYLSRLLEAQIATGGIIDMKSPVRISVQVAQKRGLLNARIARCLIRRETASYYDPMTGENLNYSELMAR